MQSKPKQTNNFHLFDQIYFTSKSKIHSNPKKNRSTLEHRVIDIKKQNKEYTGIRKKIKKNKSL